MKRIAGSIVLHGIKRTKKCKWKPDLHMITGDDKDMTALLSELQALLGQFNRPKKLKVFVNPFGGKRKAVQNMARVRGLFQLAGVCVCLPCLSSPPDHARGDGDHARRPGGRVGARL